MKTSRKKRRRRLQKEKVSAQTLDVLLDRKTCADSISSSAQVSVGLLPGFPRKPERSLSIPLPLTAGESSPKEKDPDDDDNVWDLFPFKEEEEPQYFGECMLPLSPARDSDVNKMTGLRFGKVRRVGAVSVSTYSRGQKYSYGWIHQTKGSITHTC